MGVQARPLRPARCGCCDGARLLVAQPRERPHDWSEIGVDGVPDLSPSQCAYLSEPADLLGEVLNLPLEPFTHIGPDNAELVDDQANTR